MNDINKKELKDTYIRFRVSTDKKEEIAQAALNLSKQIGISSLSGYGEYFLYLHNKNLNEKSTNHKK